jgi:hypothetical protein
VAPTEKDVITMGWTETRRRWQILREIEESLHHGATELPWTEEYAALFGEPSALLAMVRYRWQLAYDTQVDSHLHEHVLEEQRRRLDVRLAGVRRLLEAYDARGGADVAA